MTRKYDFVTKLMNGNSEALAKTRWWPRHSRSMARYMALATGKDAAAGKSVRELLMTGASEWEVTVCRPGNPLLMTEHSALEITLVDASLRKDVKAMEQVGLKLMANAKAQTEAYARKIPDFPQPLWYSLLLGHVTLFTEAIRYHMSGDGRNFDECEKRRQDNTLALARVTTEWL